MDQPADARPEPQQTPRHLRGWRCPCPCPDRRAIPASPKPARHRCANAPTAPSAAAAHPDIACPCRDAEPPPVTKVVRCGASGDRHSRAWSGRVRRNSIHQLQRPSPPQRSARRPSSASDRPLPAHAPPADRRRGSPATAWAYRAWSRAGFRARGAPPSRIRTRLRIFPHHRKSPQPIAALATRRAECGLRRSSDRRWHPCRPSQHPADRLPPKRADR